MKKAIVSVLAVALLPVFAFAGVGYYNMGLMDTAQTMKGGKFMISAANDAGFFKPESSTAWYLFNDDTLRIGYFITEEFSVYLDGNIFTYVNFSEPDKTETDIGAPGLNIKYSLGLGDTVRISAGAGFGVKVTDKSYELSLNSLGASSFNGVLCLSARLGGVGLHLQVKDAMYFFESNNYNWLKVNGAAMFDISEGMTAGIVAGYDMFDEEKMITGGPELVWNIAGPVQSNIGCYVTHRMDEQTFIRGIVRVSLLL